MIDEKELSKVLDKWSDFWSKKTDGRSRLKWTTLLRVRALVDHFPKANNWIPCSEQLPENEKEVEITYTRKHFKTGEMLYFTARAFYEDGTLTTEDSTFCWEEGADWEYVEEKDAYMIPEGWWESVSFSEEFGAVDMPVIAWRYPAEPYRP